MPHQKHALCYLEIKGMPDLLHGAVLEMSWHPGADFQLFWKKSVP